MTAYLYLALERGKEVQKTTRTRSKSKPKFLQLGKNLVLRMTVSYYVRYKCLSLLYLTTLFQWLWLYSFEQTGDNWMINRKGCGRKRPWPNLRYYPSICLVGLRKITKNLSQDSRIPGQDSKSGPTEYDAGALNIRPRRLARNKDIIANFTRLRNTLETSVRIACVRVEILGLSNGNQDC
jgi:hypothetical protein